MNCRSKISFFCWLNWPLSRKARQEQFFVKDNYNFPTIWLIPYFWYTHIHISYLASITFIFDFITFLLQFYFEEASIKIPVFVMRGCWLQWGRQTYFRKFSFSLSLSYNTIVSNKSCVWPSCECVFFSTKPVISLSGSDFFFCCMPRCLYLIFSLPSRNDHFTEW